MSDLDRAAWIPADVPDRFWDRAVSLAVDWIEQECRQQRAAAILVTAACDVVTYSATAAALARRYRQTTAPRSRWAHRRGGGTGPVFAYAPTAEALDYAMSVAVAASAA